MEMEVSGALPSSSVSVLYAAISLPCALLLLVVGEAGLRVASLALRGEMKAWWPTRAAMLGYRVPRPGGGTASSYPSSVLPDVDDDEEPQPLLPAEFCDRLAVAVYRSGKGNNGQQEAADPDCAFCLSAVRDGEEVRELRCRHVFHRACLDAWLVRPRASSPLTRSWATTTTTACPRCRRRPSPPPTPTAALSGTRRERARSFFLSFDFLIFFSGVIIALTLNFVEVAAVCWIGLDIWIVPSDLTDVPVALVLAL